VIEHERQKLMNKVDEIEDFRFEDLEMETEKDKERMMTPTTRMSYSSSSSPSPSSASSSAASSLAAKAIRASSAHRDSSLSSAYSSPSSAPVPTPPKVSSFVLLSFWCRLIVHNDSWVYSVFASIEMFQMIHGFTLFLPQLNRLNRR